MQKIEQDSAFFSEQLHVDSLVFDTAQFEAVWGRESCFGKSAIESRQLAQILDSREV